MDSHLFGGTGEEVFYQCTSKRKQNPGTPASDLEPNLEQLPGEESLVCPPEEAYREGSTQSGACGGSSRVCPSLCHCDDES